MPSVATHIDQAKHNFDFLHTFLEDNEYKDWQITVAYYTALHIFEAENTRKDPNWRAGKMALQSGSPHTWRITYVTMTFKDVGRYYRLLEERSRQARYLQNLGDHTANVITDDDAKECIEIYLQKIIDKFGYTW